MVIAEVYFPDGFDDYTQSDINALIWSNRLMLTRDVKNQMDGHDKRAFDDLAQQVEKLTKAVQVMGDLLGPQAKVAVGEPLKIEFAKNEDGSLPQEVMDFLTMLSSDAAFDKLEDIDFVTDESIPNDRIRIGTVPLTLKPDSANLDPSSSYTHIPNQSHAPFDSPSFKDEFIVTPAGPQVSPGPGPFSFDDIPTKAEPEPEQPILRQEGPRPYAEYPADSDLTTMPMKGTLIQADANMVLSDGKGVITARYQLPHGHTLIWLREDGVPRGYTIKIADEEGKVSIYQKLESKK